MSENSKNEVGQCILLRFIWRAKRATKNYTMSQKQIKHTEKKFKKMTALLSMFDREAFFLCRGFPHVKGNVCQLWSCLGTHS